MPSSKPTVRSVLLIDDEIYQTRYYVNSLTDAGFTVTLASSTDDALAILGRRRFDVIVLDVMMPPGKALDAIDTAGGFRTGISLARTISHKWPKSRIVALTSCLDHEVLKWFAGRPRMTCFGKAQVPPVELPARISEFIEAEDDLATNPNPSFDKDTVPMRTKCDVAILTALPKELDAVLRQTDNWSVSLGRNQESDRKYHTCVTKNGLSVVAACALGMGQLNAALLARNFLDDWSPRKMFLVGIAGGLSDDVRLGDIVIAEQIVDYEVGKVSSSGVSPRWSVYRSDSALLSNLLNVRDSAWKEHIKTPRPEGEKSDVPKVHFGVILSGNKVIADQATAGALSSVWSRAAAIEMEAAGIAAALYQSPEHVPFVMIKAICDRADAAKNDDWQLYAADASAAFVWAFIQAGLDERGLRVNREAVAPLPGIDYRALRLALAGAYNIAELRILVSDLGVDWDEVRGETKSERIVELIAFLKRRSRLNDLIDLVKTDRS